MKNKEMSKHHLIPKQRVREKTVNKDLSSYAHVRILHLWRNKHDYWHYLFHNLTLPEIILVLQRIEHISEFERMKNDYNK